MRYIKTKEHFEKAFKRFEVVIDMRDPVSFRDGTVDGAINLPLRNFVNNIHKFKDKKTLVIVDDINSVDTQMAQKYADQAQAFKLSMVEYGTII